MEMVDIEFSFIDILKKNVGTLRWSELANDR